MKATRFLRLVLIFSLLFSLVGCSMPQPMELSHRLIIEAIGIDADLGKAAVTLQTADAFFGDQGKEGADKKGSTKIYSFRGANVADALAQVEPATGLKPMYSQIKLIVLSEKTARAGTKKILEFFINETNLRPDIFICVTKGKAEEIITAELSSSAGAAGVLQETLRAGADTGRSVNILLYRFMSLSYSETDTALCPILSVQPSEISDGLLPALNGTAFFTDDVLAYTIDEAQTQLLLFLVGGAKQTFLTLPQPDGGTISAELTAPKVSFRLQKKSGVFSSDVRVRAICTDIRQSADKNPNESMLLDFLQTRLTEDLLACFQALCTERGFDVCRLQKRAMQKYPSFSAEKDGKELLKNVSLQVELEWK